MRTAFVVAIFLGSAAVQFQTFNLSASTRAQATSNPLHIRLTALSRYEIPGIIAVETAESGGRQGDQITGQADLDDHFVRFISPQSSTQISVLRPSRQIEGKAYSLENGTLEFLPDGYKTRSYIPVDSLARIERGQPRARRAVGMALRMLGGITAICITLAGPFGMCDDSEDQMGRCAGRYLLAIATIPPAAAIVTAARDRWAPISMAELEMALRNVNRRVGP